MLANHLIEDEPRTVSCPPCLNLLACDVDASELLDLSDLIVGERDERLRQRRTGENCLLRLHSGQIGCGV